MPAPFPVRRAVELTVLSLLGDVLVAYAWPTDTGGFGFGAAGAFFNALVMGWLLYKLAGGSSTSRFVFSASVVASGAWTLATVKWDDWHVLWELALLGLQGSGVVLLYSERAGTWYARQTLDGFR